MVITRKLNRKTGLISQTLITTLPLFQQLKQWKIEGCINFILLKIIYFYQKRVSPYKGFRCAHRVLHQDDSCSAFLVTNIKTVGLSAAVPLQIERFQQCKQAHLILRQRRQQQLSSSLSQSIQYSAQRNRRKRKTTCESIYCDSISCLDCDLSLCDCLPSSSDCDKLNLDGCDFPCDADCCDCD